MNPTILQPYSWAEIEQKLGLPPVAAPKFVQAQRQNPTRHDSASIPDLMQRQCVDGERTHHLVTLAGALLAKGFSLDDCISLCHQWNSRNIEPLEDDKIETTCASISRTDQRNHPERYVHLLDSQPLFELSAGRIDRYLASSPPPRRWLLKDLVVLGKAGAIIAPGGSSKSQWLLQLAVGVASGLPVADHWEIGERGSVLVFFAEDDEDEIHRRIKRITDHLTMTGRANDLQGIEDRLYIFSTIGHNMLLTKRDASGEVSFTGMVNQILKLAEPISDLKLIVIDPASRFRGGEENSNEDATRFVEALETLAKETGATVMIAHHTNKGSYGPDGEPGQGASRGASALTDGLRWQMNLGRLADKQLSSIGASKEQSGQYVAATVTKTNYSAFPAPVFLERIDGGYLTAMSAAQAKQRAETKAILNVLRILATQEKPITARQLEERFGGIGSTLNSPKHEVRAAVKLAVERGLLTGGDRKALQVTDLGTAMFKASDTAAEHARTPLQKPPPQKT
jgi:hypothetical protein